MLPSNQVKNGVESPGKVHGVVGVHVDDGLCGGDSVFDAAIKKLEAKYPFGAHKTKQFTFTGIQIRQDENWDIHLDQSAYVRDIMPIQVDRMRRKDSSLPFSDDERKQLRALVGSLQYAAVNTRPDIAARLSFLQTQVPHGCVNDLLEANRLLEEAKRFAATEIVIRSTPIEDLRFVAYSDASFATRAKSQSQRGCLILAVHKDIERRKPAKSSPLLWASKRVSRVVSSTLAAETYALSSAVDWLDWIRMCWAWITQPTTAWQKPLETLPSLPRGMSIVDCKSLYDLIIKNATPQCQEHRTLLDALVIKDRIRSGIDVHWVPSAAQMADALTKVMDAAVLRSFLSSGMCCIHDVDEMSVSGGSRMVPPQVPLRRECSFFGKRVLKILFWKCELYISQTSTMLTFVCVCGHRGPRHRGAFRVVVSPWVAAGAQPDIHIKLQFEDKSSKWSWSCGVAAGCFAYIHINIYIYIYIFNFW